METGLVFVRRRDNRIFGGRRHSRGMTLVEILIVLGLLALLSAISIPMLNRMGLFSGTELQNCSRELYAVLNTARLNAVSKRMDTALAYGEETITDSRSGQPVKVLTSMILVVRQDRATVEARIDTECDPVTAADIKAGLQNHLGDKINYVFVPVNEDLGTSRKMVGGTCIMLPQPANPSFPEYVDTTQLGMTNLVSSRNLPNWPNDSIPIYFPASCRLEFWPAHVFAASGQLVNDLKERFEIDVMPVPDAPVSARFTDAKSDQPNDPLKVTLELYRATGRVKIQ